MSRLTDERLIAFLDGEVAGAEHAEIAALLDRDPAARDRLAALAQSASLVRQAYDEVLREPLPDEPCDGIGGAARRERHDDPDGLGRVRLRRCDGGAGDEHGDQQDGRGDDRRSFHDGNLLGFASRAPGLARRVVGSLRECWVRAARLPTDGRCCAPAVPRA